MAQAAFKPQKPTLVDIPASNNGGRCRFVIYKKGLREKVDVVSPKVYGGMKSDEYLALNPQGLIPMLVLPDGQNLWESDVIASYLCDKYRGEGASFELPSPEDRANDLLARRVHDLYIGPIQKAMYRDMDINERESLIKRLAFQLDVLDSIIKGPYVSGSTMGLADATLFPTLTFCNFMLPQFFGWKQAFKGKQLQAYWETMQADTEASQVIREIEQELTKWKESGRWEEKGILAQVAEEGHTWAY